MIDNKTYEVVPYLQATGKKPIDYKWVYETKHEGDGSLERLKARLGVRVFTQKEWIDDVEAFSPIVKMTTIRALIVVTIKKN